MIAVKIQEKTYREEDLRRLDAVRKHRPAIAQILDTHGKVSILDFAPAILKQQRTLHIENDILTVIESTVALTQGKETAGKFIQQLKRCPVASTAEHTSLFSTPVSFQSALMSGFAHAQMGNEFCVLIPTSGVPVKDSTYPAGISWRTEGKLPFLSTRRGKGEHLVCSKAAVQPEQLAQRMTLLKIRTIAAVIVDRHPELKQLGSRKLEKAVKSYLRGNRLSPGHPFQKIDPALVTAATAEFDLVKTKIVAPFLRNSDSKYAEQIAKTNLTLWEYIREPLKLPKLIYLNTEKLFPAIFKAHMERKSFLYQMLTDTNLRSATLKAFNGKPCTWSDSKKNPGTHFFWKIKASGRAERLIVQDGCLHGTDSSFQLEMTPEKLQTALEEGQIIANTWLDLITHLASGIELSGGFNQIDLLEDYAETFKTLKSPFGQYREYQTLCSSDNKRLSDALTIFQKTNPNSGTTRAGSLYDLLINPTEIEGLTQQARETTVLDAFLFNIDEVYRMSVPLREQIP